MVKYNIKQAKEFMRKGERMFEQSEPEHIYHFKDRKFHCSCGKDVDWRYAIRGSNDWKILSKKNATIKILEECPNCERTLDKGYCNRCHVKWKISQSKSKVKVKR